MSNFARFFGLFMLNVPTVILMLMMLLMSLDVVMYSMPLIAWWLPYIAVAALLVAGAQVLRWAISK
jgi:hypothetical protein